MKEEILSRISTIIDNSSFILGAPVAEFEAEFARWSGSAHSLGVANGLDALRLALQALDVGPGDEVILPANTFAATAFAASQIGATPVLVDVEPTTYNLDPSLIERAITKKTKAIMPVHLYGQPASLAPILEIAKRHGLSIVEDCAQSHGALYQGKPAGTFGDAAGYSFYPGKNLGAMGDGGATNTQRADVLAKLKVLRDVGQSEKYHHAVVGTNSRLDALQAAILSVKLKRLSAETEDRVRAAKRYGELLGGIRQIRLPQVASDRTHVYHLYVILTEDPKDREPLRKHLGDLGIQTGLHYPIPLHQQKCYAHLGYRTGDFPVTERAAASLLSLPMFPWMTEEESKSVAAGIKGYFGC
jgi:dTDP-4-amino-4,6-dideoxygalactose transaminase